MRIGKPLKIVFVVVPLLLIVLMVGVVLVLQSTDFNQYKPLIAEEAKKATGRDLVIAGDLNFEISFSPAVAVDGVTFANAGWGSRPEMVRVDRFEAEVALLPLIFGTVEVKRVVLIGADILLEIDKKGRANFDFSGAKAKPEGGEAAVDVQIPVVHEMVVRDSRLTYSDAATGASYRAVIDALTVRGDGPDDPVTVAYRGSYNEAPVTVDARLGAPAEALSPSEPWPVDLTLRAGGATVTVKGSVEEPTKAKGLALTLAVKGEQLGELGVLAGAGMPAAGPYSVSGKLAGDLASAVKLTGLDMRLAGSDVTGNATVRLDGKRPAISAKLRSGVLDLAALGAAAGGEAKAEKKSDKVFPSDPLPLEGLRAVDARIDYRAGTLKLDGALLNDAVLPLSLSGGNLKLAPFKGTIAGGAIEGAIQFDGRKKAARLVAKLTVARMDMGQLVKDLGGGETLEGRASLKLDVTGGGGSVAAIMGSLDGSSSLVMGKGRMKSGSLQTLIGGPTQLLGKVIAGEKTDYTTINCAILQFPVKKGVATAKSLLLDTDVAAFVGKGKVNLGKETLDLEIDPNVKKTTISAAVPVAIKGTFVNPEYATKKTAVARKLGGLIGIFVFPPAAIVGLGELGESDNPCVQQARSGDQKKKEESGGAAGVLKDAGEGITKGLKGLFGD